ncbi:hypothetical protein GTA51_01555 [Desulfovibrio aerotolerans]|uniref:Uncharacterized protein n=1 Tax=Solidesulfovibrio aerotolerans TaxID=295255 RepID=A0A7C9IIZ1_9BACT|nr:hypothetical protein [Solidesulfovibrio aerotolerans]MYL81825.1 hypothetical protein [Solidesulfovibrio aerotolerans]
MGITSSIDNLCAKDALSCKTFEIRRAYVILSRDGVVTAQTLSEAQNEVLKQSVNFFEVSTDVDCDELLKTLHEEDVQNMLNDVYSGYVEDEECKNNSCIRSPEPDHEPSAAYAASMMLSILFSDIRSPEPELPASESDFDDIKF